MSFIGVRYTAEFHLGDDVVVLAMDSAGIPLFRTALTDALRRGSAELRHDGITHEFQLRAGAADIELSTDHVRWLPDRAQLERASTQSGSTSA